MSSVSILHFVLGRAVEVLAENVYFKKPVSGI
jgi:hypothetical protein